MKKFSLVIENIENQKYYKIKSEVELIIESSNQGEAAYIADSTLSSIKNQSNYNITLIEETDKQQYDNLVESFGPFGRPIPYSVDSYKEQLTDEQKILRTWEAEFGLEIPTAPEKLEFYHNMRVSGFDGLLIQKVLSDKLLGKN